MTNVKMKQKRGCASVWLTPRQYKDLWESWELRGQNPDWLKNMKWDLWDGEEKVVENVTLSANAVDIITSWDVSSEQGWNPHPTAFAAYAKDETIQFDFYGDMAQPELSEYFNF